MNDSVDQKVLAGSSDALGKGQSPITGSSSHSFREEVGLAYLNEEKFSGNLWWRHHRSWGFIINPNSFVRASLVAQPVKNLPVMQETWVGSLGGEDPLEKEMETHSSLLYSPFQYGESHGRRSLVGYSSRVAKSRTRLSDFTFTFIRRFTVRTWFM